MDMPIRAVLRQGLVTVLPAGLEEPRPERAQSPCDSGRSVRQRGQLLMLPPSPCNRNESSRSAISPALEPFALAFMVQ